MTITTTALLLLSMIVLAITPGPGMLVVLARSLAGGFRHGAMTTIGIVFGDYVFILLAVYGLINIAEAMGNLFVIIKYIGAAYLVFLGIQLLRIKPKQQKTKKAKNISYLADFFLGSLPP